MDARSKEWIEAHNTRRQYYHELIYVKTYIPLVWSKSLASDAQAWADAQNKGVFAQADGSGCVVYTQGRNDIGQTTYAYWTTKNDGLDSPEDILSCWVDDEAVLDWPENKRFVQVIWRASKVC
jgi:hypothetical protein